MIGFYDVVLLKLQWLFIWGGCGGELETEYSISLGGTTSSHKVGVHQELYTLYLIFTHISIFEG